MLPQQEQGELAMLRSEIGKMTVRLRENAQRQQEERVRLADAMADISHQLRTPLTAMLLTLSLLEQELELDSPPLPELMERLISRSAGPARALFQGCRESLDRLSREPFSQSWRRLTETLPGLDEEARRALSPLGDTLGRCDWQEQQRRVAAVRGRIETLRAQAEEEQRRQGKVCRALGAAGGAFLVILLL